MSEGEQTGTPETNGAESRLVRFPESGDKSSPCPASTASSPNGVTETDFVELKDGTLVELVKDASNPGRTRLAAWKDGQVRFTDRHEQDGQVFVPLAWKDDILARLRLPSTVMPCESVQELLRRLESLISQCIAVDEKYVSVLADFVMSTWFVDKLSVAPYLSVVGLPQSGKTTLLKLLSRVCRRSLLIADITSASFYRACTRFMPTLLIDEAGTAANNRTLRHILRSGTTRDVLAIRKDYSFHSYGAKVISWLESPDDAALNSRCVLIPMFESKSAALVRTEEPAVQQLALELQAQLLRFRFENYKSVKPAPVPGDEGLRPRTRDLLHALTAAHADVQRSQRLLTFFESGQGVQAEPLDPEHNAVLRALFSTVHCSEDFSSMRIKDLTREVNRSLQLEGEKLRLQPRKVGAVLTTLGFSSRTRTNSGWTVSLSRRDAEKLHQLVASYGVDRAGRSFRNISADKCSLCRAAGLDRNGPTSAPEGTTRLQIEMRRALRNHVSSLVHEVHGRQEEQ
jgi:hypothetical protein